MKLQYVDAIKESKIEERELIDKLEKAHVLSEQEFILLIENRKPDLSEYLLQKSKNITNQIFGNEIYIRELIEFINYCKNDCFYCGIRCSNKNE